MKTINLEFIEVVSVGKYEEANFNAFSNKERTDLLRSAILSVLEQNESIYKAFYFEKYDYPDVIWQKPFNNRVIIHLKEQSEPYRKYGTFIKMLFENLLIVKDKTYKLSNFNIFDNYMVTAPIRTENKIRYKMVTPLLLFTGKKFPIFYAITKDAKSKAEEKELLKKKAKELIISNLKWQVQKATTYRDLSIFDSIDIEWEDFNIKFIEYHKDEKKTPAIFGSFYSYWELPKFVGHKIGKGFGQINMVKQTNLFPTEII